LILQLYISQRTIYPQEKSVHQAMLLAYQRLTSAIIAAKSKAKQSKMGVKEGPVCAL
jgi:hypothetical protein